MLALCAWIALTCHAAETTTLLVPTAPGGLIHRYAIELSPILGKTLGTSIVPEFKIGAQGLVAAQTLVENTSSKTTLLIGSPQTWSEFSKEQKILNQMTDMVPIAFLGTIPGSVFTHPNKEFKNFKEAIEYANNKKKLSYGIPISSANVKLFRAISRKYSTPENLMEVPYKTGAPAIVDVMGGHLDIGVSTSEAILQYIEEDKLKPLAVFADHRSYLLPNVPTLKELGVSIPTEYKYYNNMFLWANKNANPDDIKKLREVLGTYLTSKESDHTRKKIDVQIGNRSVTQPEKYLKELLVDD